MVMQEIWDFVLTFEDWKAKNLYSLFKKDKDEEEAFLNEMKENGFQSSFCLQSSSKNRVRSELSASGSANVEWSKFDREMNFRGYISQLDSEILEIEIQPSRGGIMQLQNSRIKKSSYDLKGIVANGMVKVNMVGSGLPSSLEGKIVVNSLPKYRQQGEESVLNEKEIYFCMRFAKLDIKSFPTFVEHPVALYVTVEWVGF